MSGDSVRVASPLFPVEGQGSIPMSPLQFNVTETSWEMFKKLNKLWHSRLPDVGAYYIDGVFFCGVYKNVYFCVAGWSAPIARMLNNKGYYELRRFAISEDAPKNTASRILKIMGNIIKKTKPNIYRLISYQDTDVHFGTIYKANGWIKTSKSKPNDKGWVDRHPRRSSKSQTISAKIRWEKQIRQGQETKTTVIKPPKKVPQKGLFDL